MSSDSGRHPESRTPPSTQLALLPSFTSSASSSGPQRAATPDIRNAPAHAPTHRPQLNRAREAAGERVFDSPRNAAAGSLRLLDPSQAAGRRLSFLGYQLLVPGATGGGGKVRTRARAAAANRPLPWHAFTAPGGVASAGLPRAFAAAARAAASLCRAMASHLGCTNHPPVPLPPSLFQDPIPGATAAVTTGSASLPPTQSGCLSWLAAAGVAVSGDARPCAGFDSAVAAAQQWMDDRGELRERSLGS